jgi:hypothetical protein
MPQTFMDEPGASRRDQPSGGARRDRTDDLMLAKHALSQLSYGPEPNELDDGHAQLIGGPGRT